MPSDTDILLRELDKWSNSDEVKELMQKMDNINTTGRCIFCGEICGSAHLLCVRCYGELKLLRGI